jgi:flavin-binding protein dodecin
VAGISADCKIREIGTVTDHVYKLVELVGTSPESVTDAIQNAIARASATIRNIRWFEVVQVRGDVADGKVAHYQVTLKVGFTLEEGQAALRG